jgi:hypothetical protein
MKRSVAVSTLLATAVMLAPAASAQGETLHFFQVSGPTRFFNAEGHAIHLNPPATLPVKGDSFVEVDLDYVGTSEHHAARWTASDQLACTFTSADTARCDSQIAIGGSMLISSNVTLRFKGPADAPIPITGGSGAYRGVRGWFTDVNLPNSQDSNVTVRLS